MPYLSPEQEKLLGVSSTPQDEVDFSSDEWTDGLFPNGKPEIVTSALKPREALGRVISTRERRRVGQFFNEASARLERILAPSNQFLVEKQLLVVKGGRIHHEIIGATADDPYDLKILEIYHPGRRREMLEIPIQERVDKALRLLAEDHFVTTMFDHRGRPSDFCESYYPGVVSPFDYEFIGMTPEAAILMMLEQTDGEFGESVGDIGPVRIETADPVLNSVRAFSLSAAITEYNDLFSTDGLPEIVAIPGKFFVADDGSLAYKTCLDFIPPFGGYSRDVTIFQRVRLEDRTVKK